MRSWSALVRHARLLAPLIPLAPAALLAGFLSFGAVRAIAQQPQAQQLPSGAPVGSSPGTVGTPVYVKEPNQSQGIWLWAIADTEICQHLHLAEAGNLVSYTFSYYAGGPGPLTVDVNFYADTNGSQPGPLIAAFSYPGMPGATWWTQTFDLATPVPVPQDLWMGVRVHSASDYASWTMDMFAPTVGSTSRRTWIGAPHNFGFVSDFVQHVTIRIGEPQLVAAKLAFGTAPATTVKEDHPWNPFTVRIEDAHGELVATASDPVTVSLAHGTGTLTGSLTRTPINGIATFDDLAYDKAETIAIDVTSGTLQGIAGTPVLVQPFVSDLRIVGADIAASPSIPQVAQPVQLTALVRNVGQEAATARASFYLGDPDFGGIYLGQETVPIPVGGSATFHATWTPATDGSQSIFVVVENLTPPEATPADNRAARSFTVAAAPQKLQVVGGQQVAWPGARSSVAITINNVGAGPATITSTTFGPPAWLTPVTPLLGKVLQPGESFVALAELDVPPGTPGAPLGSTPLVQTIPLAVGTASDTFTGAFTVKLFAQPTGTVTVRVEDAGTHAALVGALVSAQDLPGAFVTNGVGEVTMALPPGSRALFAYKQSYIAAAATFTIAEGASTVTLGLAPGATLAVEQIVSEPLTTQEILERGVTVSDPINNYVVDFVVGMLIGPPLVLPNVEVPRAPPPGTTYEFSGIAYTTTGENTQGNSRGLTFYGGGCVVVAQFRYHEYGRTETWILIPGQVCYLKEFFDVTTIVVNNATAANPADIQLQGIAARLTLPAGLGLPDLEGQPQQLTQQLGTLNAGESTQATWVIRGDLPGRYTLTGLVAADLVAFPSSPNPTRVPISATAISREFAVTVPSIRLEFRTPESVQENVPFTFGVLATNLGSTPANLLRVTLRSEDLVNCRIDPVQPQATLTYGNGAILSAQVNLGDLAPATSGLAEFRLLSNVTGRVLRVETSISSGDPSPSVEVRADPPVINQHPASQFACAGHPVRLWVDAVGAPPLSYQWLKDGQPIAGANAYEYLIGSVTLADAGAYHVVVSNPGGSTPSAPATLSVGVPVQITSQPQSQHVRTGGPVTFSVGATGTAPITYQWRRNGTDLPNANSASFTIDPVAVADAGNYDVVVSNPCGPVTSEVAVLTVNSPPVITCNNPVVLWSPNHELVDVRSVFGVSDPDAGDTPTVRLRVISDEPEIPDTGDGTGRHAPDFKNELVGGRGLLLRSERRGAEDGRFYLIAIEANDGRGGVSFHVCVAAVCPHDQNLPASVDAALAQATAAAPLVEAALATDFGATLPAGLHEHGLSAPLGPIQ